MNTITNFLRVRVAATAALMLLAASCLPSRAQDSTNAPSPAEEADKAWRAVNRASQPPFPPAAWSQKQPTPEEQSAYYVPILIKAANLAKDFYTRYPDHPKAAEARKKEFSLLSIAAGKFGDTNETVRLAVLEDARMKDPAISQQERDQIEQNRVAYRVEAIRGLLRGLPDTQDELEKAAEAFRKDFPKRPEPYTLLMMLAERAGPEKSKAMMQEIADSDAPDAIKDQAKGALHQSEALGKPVNIKFTAVDGREVDLTQMKNKVVLIDFWATWCGPCVGEIPNVKAAYDKLHAKGFEIVGISLDQKKDALEKFVAKEQMEWPQYFDGKVWENDYAVKYGIHGIPAMWLVDKKGNLRDLDARGAIEEKVEKLLEE